MNSRLAEKPVVGAPPQIHHQPSDVHSLAAATEAIELAEAYGLALDDAQQTTLLTALGERADGSWSASEVGDFKGRQAGKGDTESARVLAGLQLFGERLIIHTAHEFPTANEAFLRLVATHENFDDLRRQVARIRYANGEQGIEYRSGQRLKYRARTSGSSKGFAEVDLIVYDEAQNLHPEHLSASLPAMLANPNFQAWFAGSGGFTHSSVAHRMRRRAILGDGPRMAFTENTAQTTAVVGDQVILQAPPVESFLDHDVLMTHPGYAAGRVPFESMETMFNQLGPEAFGREILNIWEPELSDLGGVIPAQIWEGLVEPGSTIATHDQWALAVSPVVPGHDQWASLACAGRRVDGRIHIEAVDRRVGTWWVQDRVVQIWNEKHLPVRILKSGAEAALIAPLREAGVKVTEVTPAEYARATGQLIDAANAGTLAHLGQPTLDKALRGAQLRITDSGASIWSQRLSSVELSPLVAVTVALGGVPSEMRAPRIYSLTPSKKRL